MINIQIYNIQINRTPHTHTQLLPEVGYSEVKMSKTSNITVSRASADCRCWNRFDSDTLQ